MTRRKVWSLLGWGLLLAVGLLTWPVQLGGGTGYVVVAGNSMSGTYDSGDLVVTRSQDGYRRGQVAVFTVPDGVPGEGIPVVHRLVGGDGDTGWTTRGDDVDVDDPWSPTDEDVVGAVVLHLPGTGYVVTTLLNPYVLAALVGGLVTAAVLIRPEESAETSRSPRGAGR